MKRLLKTIIYGAGMVILVAVAAYFILRWRNEQQGYSITLDDPAATSTRSVDPVNLLLGPYLQFRAADLNTPPSTDSTPTVFDIEPGTAASTIAQQLQSQGLIDDSLLFRLFLRYNNLDTALEAGHYVLARNLSIKQLALTLQQGRPEEIILTIPEGWRAEQIAELLTQVGAMDGDAFLEVVRQGTAVDHPLLADRPLGRSYEGYLYPDTYRLPLDATPEDLIELMLETMASKLPPDPFRLAQAQGRTFYDSLSIASIVEREAVVDEERPIIASVYHNRLAPGSPHPYMESDSTVQYAMGYQPDTGQWWKTPVTLAEFDQVDSPYNTYHHPGLPPGPIANAGAATINAVLQPAQTDYYFYVCRQPDCVDGQHVFSKTYEEHLRNVERYYGR